MLEDFRNQPSFLIVLEKKLIEKFGSAENVYQIEVKEPTDHPVFIIRHWGGDIDSLVSQISKEFGKLPTQVVDISKLLDFPDEEAVVYAAKS